MQKKSAIHTRQTTSAMQKIDPQQIKSHIEAATARAHTLPADTSRSIVSLLDYTTLKECDSPRSVTAMVGHALAMIDSGAPAVASICVYPSLVESVGNALADHPAGDQISISAVCGAFPSGQTYLEVKALECAMAIENGADEIDTLIHVSAIMEGDHDVARSELALLREEIGEEALLKVILETGTLAAPEIIYRAAMIAMEAGCDFIKSSTGKSPIGATPTAVVVMALAAADYYAATGRRVGIKISGGVTTAAEALQYYAIIELILGSEWLNKRLLRFGASKLLDSLLQTV